MNGLTAGERVAYLRGDGTAERHRRTLDRPLLVAFVGLCGAMARLID